MSTHRLRLHLSCPQVAHLHCLQQNVSVQVTSKPQRLLLHPTRGLASRVKTHMPMAISRICVELLGQYLSQVNGTHLYPWRPFFHFWSMHGCMHACMGACMGAWVHAGIYACVRRVHECVEACYASVHAVHGCMLCVGACICGCMLCMGAGACMCVDACMHAWAHAGVEACTHDFLNVGACYVWVHADMGMQALVHAMSGCMLCVGACRRGCIRVWVHAGVGVPP